MTAIEQAGGDRVLQGWSRAAAPTRVVAVVVLVLLLATGGLDLGTGGLLERLLALVAALGVALLAAAVLRRPEPGRVADAVR